MYMYIKCTLHVHVHVGYMYMYMYIICTCTCICAYKCTCTLYVHVCVNVIIVKTWFYIISTTCTLPSFVSVLCHLSHDVGMNKVVRLLLNDSVRKQWPKNKPKNDCYIEIIPIIGVSVLMLQLVPTTCDSHI